MQPEVPERSNPIPSTVGAAIDRALDALDGLAALGEDVEDEWQYVQDLHAAWRDRLAEVAASRAGDSLAVPAGAAIARLAEEAALVRDPHRAIDWLSTFPQAVLLALGEAP